MYPLVMNVPPSPPETNITLGGPAHGPQYRTLHGGSGSVSGIHDSASIAGPSVAGPTLRRQPSIFYNSPGLSRGEARERSSSSASKLLVIVVPPQSVTHEHGTLGHTLSCGPSHRLPQGIVMPLFPNMYGQMTAIAKEFNFPSIAGLCLYYCFSDGEFSMTPRLSEDIWSTMWGLPEAASQPRDRRPPIVGRLEFDIDMAKARWYGAWLSSRQRETTSDYPFYHPPVTAPSQHFRGDSRFTFPHTAVTDDISEPAQPQNSAPAGRHVPRKLSLVERFDVQSSHGTDVGAQEVRLPSGLPISSVLSPIQQLEEPKTARAELDNKVNTWRATAVASPVPMPEASLPHESVVEPSTPSEVPLRMEDFQWSVSSAGPDDSASVSYGSDIYQPSIHLADRVNGSVASTVSWCTSNGPSDYSVWFSMLDSRVASPDVAHRMFEDIPPTPSTATSWGAPTHYSASLRDDEYEPSIDIGYRGEFSRPVTPVTATSWGAPTHYSASIYSDDYEPSIDLGYRGEFSRPLTPITATSWGAPTGPSSPFSPHRLLTPDIAHRNFEDTTGRDFSSEGQIARAKASHRVPAITKVTNRKKTVQSSQLGSGYPLFNIYPAAPMKDSLSDPCSYPHNLRTIYPAVTRPVGTANVSLARYPYFNLYPAAYPFNLDRIYLQEAGALAKPATLVPASVATKSQYPSFELYPAEYPFNLDYVYPAVYTTVKSGAVPTASQLRVVEQVLESWRPWRHAWPYNRQRMQSPKASRWATAVSKVARTKEEARPTTSARVPGSTGSGYPHLDIYPAVVKVEASRHQDPNGYPLNLKVIYPALSRPRGTTSRSQYPYFEIYPAVYPFNLETIYTPFGPASVTKSSVWPTIAPVKINFYPFLEIYAPVYPFNLDVVYPVIQSRRKVTTPSAKLVKSSYPHFEIYPTLYPFFNLYPTVAARPQSWTVHQPATRIPTSTSSYPHFILYPTAYPYFNLYPSIPGRVNLASKAKVAAAPTTGYPHFNLYAPLYPHFNIYPRIAGQCAASRQRKKDAPASSTSGYPHFTLYPALYPHFDLYPAMAGSLKASSKSKWATSSNPTAGYPYFTLYPPVYPHFKLYPPVSGRLRVKHSSRIAGFAATRFGYPTFDIYPSVYPHFNLYPSIACTSTSVAKDRQQGMTVAVESKYPYIVLYPAVYPHLNLYPPTPLQSAPAAPLPFQKKAVTFAVKEVKESRPKSGRLTHAELHAMVMMESRGKKWLDEADDSFPDIPDSVSGISNAFPDVPRAVPSVPRTIAVGRSRAPSISISRTQPQPLHVPSSSRDSTVPTTTVHKPLPLRRHPFPTEPIRPSSVYRENRSPSSSTSGSPVTPQREGGGMTRSNSVAVRPRPRPPTSVPLSQRRSMWEATSPPPTGPLPTRPLTVASRGDSGPPSRRDTIVSQRVRTFTTATAGTGGYI